MMGDSMFKVLATSVVNRAFDGLPKVRAVDEIMAYHGYDYVRHVDHAWIGWPSKLLYLIDVCRRMTEYTHILFMDAADVVALAGPDVVMERWRAFDHPWVYNAEPFIWSHGSFQPEDYPTPPEALYRYLNSGACIGEREHMVDWFDRWTDGFVNYPLSLPRGDQDWMAARFIDAFPAAIKLDINCELFQCMCGSLAQPEPHCTMLPGEVRNNTTGTSPLIIHFNGGDDITSPDRRLLWHHWL